MLVTVMQPWRTAAYAGVDVADVAVVGPAFCHAQVVECVLTLDSVSCLARAPGRKCQGY